MTGTDGGNNNWIILCRSENQSQNAIANLDGDVYGSVHHNMRPCSRIYYSNVS
jgi:hypothetical protein